MMKWSTNRFSRSVVLELVDVNIADENPSFDVVFVVLWQEKTWKLVQFRFLMGFINSILNFFLKLDWIFWCLCLVLHERWRSEIWSNQSINQSIKFIMEEYAFNDVLSLSWEFCLNQIPKENIGVELLDTYTHTEQTQQIWQGFLLLFFGYSTKVRDWRGHFCGRVWPATRNGEIKK